MLKLNNIIKALIFSIIIFCVFIVFFSILQVNEDAIWMAQTIMILFTILLCTYGIINELRDIKEKSGMDNDVPLENEIYISLDNKLESKEQMVVVIEQYCIKKKLNYKFIKDNNDNMECLIEINGVKYRGIMRYTGRASEYVIYLKTL